MEKHLDKIWEEASSTFGAVRLYSNDHESYVYKGIKIVRYNGIVTLYSTETEFYKSITKYFYGKSFLEGVRSFLSEKYLNKLDSIEKMIQREMNNQKNHKRFKYLKTMRNTYLKKYNEINS